MAHFAKPCLLLLIAVSCRGPLPPVRPKPNLHELWTAPIYFHNIPFMFELENTGKADFRWPTSVEDSIRLGHRHVIYRGGEFYIGARRFAFDHESRILLHLPAKMGSLWRLNRPELEIAWVGNGRFYSIEERNHRLGTSWHCHKATVQLKSEGRVLYTGPSGRRTFPTPIRMRLDRSGKLLASSKKG